MVLLLFVTLENVMAVIGRYAIRGRLFIPLQFSEMTMNDAQAAWVLAALLFGLFVYVMNWKRAYGKLPSVRNPFYNK